MTPQNQSFRRGDILLVLFPNSDLQTAKTRPALVVQSDGLNAGLNQTIVAMITSQKSRANHPSRVTILLSTNIGKASGLLNDSIIMTDNLATIMNASIIRNIGNLKMDEINVAIKITLGLL